MSQTKSKRLISDFRESILPTGPHNGVGTQLMRQLRRLQRSTMCSPLDPPAECPATGSLRARWEPRTGVRSLGSHRRYPSRRPFRRAASREEQVLPLRGSGWITIFRAAKCNPCVCLKCHPCLCPLPTPALSPLRGEGVFGALRTPLPPAESIHRVGLPLQLTHHLCILEATIQRKGEGAAFRPLHGVSGLSVGAT